MQKLDLQTFSHLSHEKKGAPMAANSGVLCQMQSSCTVLGCEHRSLYRMWGPRDTLKESVSNS